MDVVLLHGFGENDEIWDEFLLELPKNHTYHCLDYSRLTFCQSIEEYADWVHSEIEQLGIFRFAIIGHSMGGYISLAYAEKHGEYLSGIGLFHSTAYADPEEKKRTREKTIGFLDKKGTEPFITNFLPTMYSHTYQRKNGVKIKKLLETNMHIPKEALMQATAAMMVRPDRTNVLKTSKLPILYIVGKADPFIDYQDALAQLAFIQRPFSLILDDVAHAGMKEATHLTAALMVSFLEECDK